MGNRAKNLTFVLFLITCGVLVGLLSTDTSLVADNERSSTGRGNVGSLLANYQIWETAYIKNGGDQNMILPLGPFKGLSTERSNAFGQAKLNLIDGKVSVEVQNLPEPDSWDVWLVENRPGTGRSVMPEAGDVLVRIGGLKKKGPMARLEITLGTEAFAKFEPDLITITRPAELLRKTGF